MIRNFYNRYQKYLTSDDKDFMLYHICSVLEHDIYTYHNQYKAIIGIMPINHLDSTFHNRSFLDQPLLIDDALITNSCFIQDVECILDEIIKYLLTIPLEDSWVIFTNLANAMNYPNIQIYSEFYHFDDRESCSCMHCLNLANKLIDNCTNCRHEELGDDPSYSDNLSPFFHIVRIRTTNSAHYICYCIQPSLGRRNEPHRYWYECTTANCIDYESQLRNFITNGEEVSGEFIPTKFSKRASF